MIFRIAFCLILLSAAYGVYRMFRAIMSDFEDDESYFVGMNIITFDICATIVLGALAILFAGGAK